MPVDQARLTLLTKQLRALMSATGRRSITNALAEEAIAQTQLGFAESYAGDPQAAAHLEQALSTAAEPTAQVSITLALGRMLQIDGRNREALEVFDRTRARLASTDRSAALTLEGAALGAAQLDAETAGDAAERIARLRRLAEQDPGVPPSVFGMLAIALMVFVLRQTGDDTRWASIEKYVKTAFFGTNIGLAMMVVFSGDYYV